MLKFLALTTLLTTLVLGDTTSKLTVEKYSPLLSRVRRIINGTRSPIETTPWLAAVVYEISGLVIAGCGGSIISPNWIVTAAHCLVYPNKTTGPVKYISTGSAYWRDGQFHRVIEMIHHPSYDSQKKDGPVINDIGLIKVAKPFDFDLTRNYIELYNGNVTKLINKTAITSGWGTISALFVWTSEYLHSAEVTILSKSDCDEIFSSYSNGTMITEGKICVRNVGKGTPCIRDSGGPLIVKEPNGNNVLVGITSWSPGDLCGAPEDSVVYTEIFYHRDWILSTISPSIYPETNTSYLLGGLFDEYKNVYRKIYACLLRFR